MAASPPSGAPAAHCARSSVAPPTLFGGAPVPVDPEVLRLLHDIEAQSQSQLHEMSVKEARPSVEDLASLVKYRGEWAQSQLRRLRSSESGTRETGPHPPAMGGQHGNGSRLPRGRFGDRQHRTRRRPPGGAADRSRSYDSTIDTFLSVDGLLRPAGDAVLKGAGAHLRMRHPTPA
jgi:hypothetical protein